MENKLSNNEEIVIRLLYTQRILSSEIPPIFFGEDEKKNLLELGLITLEEDSEIESYVVTEKAANIIETGGYIIKYPLHNDEGVVLNYKDVLNSCTPKSARALGLSIINTQFWRNWGKTTNMILHKELQDSIDYYRTFDHPISKITSYKNDIDLATARYEKVIDFEFNKIKDFDLIKPIYLGSNVHNQKIELKKIINPKTGLFKIGTTDDVIVNFDDNNDFYLSKNHKYEIIRQYYIMKSKPKNGE
jgi:hypothetical protein